MLNYGRALSEHTRYAAAEAIDREALDAARASLGNDNRVTLALTQDLGSVLHKEGHDVDAEPLLRTALARHRATLGDPDPETRGSLNALAEFLMDTGRFEEAEPICAELYKSTAAAQMNPRNAAMNMARWGICLTKLGRYNQADAPLHEAYKRLDASGLRRGKAMFEVMAALADTAAHTNHSEDAAKWTADLAELRASTRVSTTSAASRPS
jgi:tetratricopeptide (TPR) repeat protein